MKTLYLHKYTDYISNLPILKIEIESDNAPVEYWCGSLIFNNQKDFDDFYTILLRGSYTENVDIKFSRN